MKGLIYAALTVLAMYLGFVYAECPDTNVEAVCLTMVILILALDVIQLRRHFTKGGEGYADR